MISSFSIKIKVSSCFVIFTESVVCLDIYLDLANRVLPQNTQTLIIITKRRSRFNSALISVIQR